MTQQTAQGLASLGRGPDSMLVHMAPGEVKSLQQLAMAHGGSLTINPETGLPEAGFLSSILPMVLGAGAMMIPGLQGLGAAGIGLGLGGFEALRTGSLKKGLMAGFGAYGGAGLAGGLTAAGAASGAGAAGAGTPEILGGIGTQPATFSGNLAQAGQGITALPTSEAARTAFMGNAALKGSGVGGAKGLMQYGLAAAAPMMMETTTKQPEIKTDKDMGQRYQFNAGAPTPTPPADVPGYGDQSQNFGKEQRYFNPRYTPIDNDAARKLYGFAYGGPVEDMSNGNDMAAYMGQDKFAEGGEVGGYTYDPVTQMYTKKAGEGATMVSPVGGISGASGSSGSSDYVDPNPGWSNMTDREKAAYYAANPTMAAITQLGQKGFGLTSLGMLQNYFSPETVNTASLNAQGFDRGGGFLAEPSGMTGPQGQTSYQSGVGNPGEGDGGFTNDAGGSEPSGSLGFARGGISHLGDYSDGGRLLRGPGDGISDSIPAMIGKKQPARLADGEFVVPARIVSELGNGSTEAGARKLYAMMDRVQKARGKTVGKGKVAANSRSAKYLPA